ncbi:hypothetical protein F4678DRAFT_425047 [Xylaria arbuscula]|nr:hypothetical protein F4678DRAFT_425047 [Xylaria arbuscula]
MFFAFIAASRPEILMDRPRSSGIDEKIKEAYSFICRNYNSDKNHEKGRGETEIILIGFSRGAFNARCVADLIDKIRILTKMGIHYLPDIYDAWQEDGKDFNKALLEAETLSLHPTAPSPAPIEVGKDRQTFMENLGSTLSNPKYVYRGVHVKVCAVWDTVASLGYVSTHLRILKQWKSRKLAFVNSNLCSGIDHAIQALSLHEHRRPFCPIVWKLPDKDKDNQRNGKPRLQQCWFMDYHSDIGGGVRGEGLASFPLAWMISKLSVFLTFDASIFGTPRPGELRWKFYNANDPSSGPYVKLKDSMSKRYQLAGSYYRKPKRHFWLPSPKTCEPDKYKSSETVHFTVRLLEKNNFIGRPKMMEGITRDVEEAWR